MIRRDANGLEEPRPALGDSEVSRGGRGVRGGRLQSGGSARAATSRKELWVPSGALVGPRYSQFIACFLPVTVVGAGFGARRGSVGNLRGCGFGRHSISSWPVEFRSSVSVRVLVCRLLVSGLAGWSGQRPRTLHLGVSGCGIALLGRFGGLVFRDDSGVPKRKPLGHWIPAAETLVRGWVLGLGSCHAG